MDNEQEPMPRANVVPLLEAGFDGPQCLQAEQWAQDYAKTYTRTKLERLAIRIDQRGWEEEAEVMRAAARDTDQALTLLAMLHGRVCHMMAHLGMMGEIDTRHATIEKLGDALDDVNEFVFRVLECKECATQPCAHCPGRNGTPPRHRSGCQRCRTHRRPRRPRARARTPARSHPCPGWPHGSRAGCARR